MTNMRYGGVKFGPEATISKAFWSLSLSDVFHFHFQAEKSYVFAQVVPSLVLRQLSARPSDVSPQVGFLSHLDALQNFNWNWSGKWRGWLAPASQEASQPGLPHLLTPALWHPQIHLEGIGWNCPARGSSNNMNQIRNNRTSHYLSIILLGGWHGELFSKGRINDFLLLGVTTEWAHW